MTTIPGTPVGDCAALWRGLAVAMPIGVGLWAALLVVLLN